MRISDWSSDVCSSDLVDAVQQDPELIRLHVGVEDLWYPRAIWFEAGNHLIAARRRRLEQIALRQILALGQPFQQLRRSEERRGGKEWVSTGRSRWSPYH